MLYEGETSAVAARPRPKSTAEEQLYVARRRTRRSNGVSVTGIKQREDPGARRGGKN